MVCAPGMVDLTSEIQAVQDLIEGKKREIRELEERLDELKKKAFQHKVETSAAHHRLTNDEILRYSRQLILPQIGVQGQLKLKHSSVLIVGCGGLGCPVAIYLAGAGVGKLGLVDYDVVEMTNLHRQIGHNILTINQLKCSSLANTCLKLNPEIRIDQHALSLNSSNAMDIIKQYDVIVDATDNVATRYLLNDACVLNGKPLVSGSVLRFDGQLTIYNYDSTTPCYRCLYPLPPSPNLVTNCSDGGVLGPVVGFIGTLQAIETIKLIVGLQPSFAKRLLIFDGLDGMMKSIKLRNKQKDCSVCGDSPSVRQLIDYVTFCGAGPDDKDKPVNLLKSHDRITAQAYSEMLKTGVRHVLVDVREPVELDICQLPHPSINVRMRDLKKESTKMMMLSHLKDCGSNKVVVLCRRGNDSQEAVVVLRSLLTSLSSAAENNSCINNNDNNNNNNGNNNSNIIDNHNSNNDDVKNTVVNNCVGSDDGDVFEVVDIVGGLYAWKKSVDQDFPIY